MTPEPKAPASDLDAAVATVKRNIGQYVGASPVVVHAANLTTLLAALSSQAEAAEGMAKALEGALSHCGTADGYLDCGKPATDAMRTALSQYRTLGGE